MCVCACENYELHVSRFFSVLFRIEWVHDSLICAENIDDCLRTVGSN